MNIITRRETERKTGLGTGRGGKSRGKNEGKCCSWKKKHGNYCELAVTLEDSLLGRCFGGLSGVRLSVAEGLETLENLPNSEIAASN